MPLPNDELVKALAERLLDPDDAVTVQYRNRTVVIDYSNVVEYALETKDLATALLRLATTHTPEKATIRAIQIKAIIIDSAHYLAGYHARGYEEQLELDKNEP